MLQVRLDVLLLPVRDHVHRHRERRQVHWAYGRDSSVPRELSVDSASPNICETSYIVSSVQHGDSHDKDAVAFATVQSQLCLEAH